MRRGLRAKTRQFQDSVLDTCRSLEDWSGTEESAASSGLPGVPSGLMTVDFNDDANWNRLGGAMKHGSNKENFCIESPASVHSMLKTPETAYVYGITR